MNTNYIVSMTSWEKRIAACGGTIFSFLRQTIPPKKIILNLSVEEFPGLDNIPDDIKTLQDKLFPFFEINFVEGANTKAFKKVIPSIQKYKHSNIDIIAADDDIYYMPNYAEYMLGLRNEHPNCYFTPGTWGEHVHGYAMIYSPTWFKNDLLFSLTDDEMEQICSSDLWLTACLHDAGIEPFVDNNIENLMANKKLTKTALGNQYSKIPLNERLAIISNAISRYYTDLQL